MGSIHGGRAMKSPKKIPKPVAEFIKTGLDVHLETYTSLKITSDGFEPNKSLSRSLGEIKIVCSYCGMIAVGDSSNELSSGDTDDLIKWVKIHMQKCEKYQQHINQTSPANTTKEISSL